MSAAQRRRVLVTGGTGMIGAALVRRLVGEGREVFVLARPSANRLRLQSIEAQVTWLAGDIRDAESVRRAVRQAAPAVVYHLASTPFNPPTITAATHLETIVSGTANLLDALNDQPGVRLVAAGSSAEYGSGTGLREDQPLRPGTVLGAAKASAGLLIHAWSVAYGLQAVVLRLFTPYGPWESPGRLIPHTILSALDGREIAMTRGDQQRDFVYLDDVVEALRLAGDRTGSPGTVLNIGSGIGRPVRTVVTKILELMGHPVRANLGALPTRADEIMEMSADVTAAAQLLEWSPQVSLDEGLGWCIEWIRGHRELLRQLDARSAHAPAPVAA